jgi:hypothetical protein
MPTSNLTPDSARENSPNGELDQLTELDCDTSLVFNGDFIDLKLLSLH